MSKALQNYDVWQARPLGYQGTLDEVIAQIKNEPDHGSDPTYTRYELLSFLGVNKIPSAGPSVEMDAGAFYG